MTHNSQPLIYYIDTHLIFTKITIVRILKIVMTKSYVTVLFKQLLLVLQEWDVKTWVKVMGF